MNSQPNHTGQSPASRMAEVIAGILTFEDLEQARREFLATSGLTDDEDQLFEAALALRQRELIEYYGTNRHHVVFNP